MAHESGIEREPVDEQKFTSLLRGAGNIWHSRTLAKSLRGFSISAIANRVAGMHEIELAYLKAGGGEEQKLSGCRVEPTYVLGFFRTPEIQSFRVPLLGLTPSHALRFMAVSLQERPNVIVKGNTELFQVYLPESLFPETGVDLPKIPTFDETLIGLAKEAIPLLQADRPADASAFRQLSERMVRHVSETYQSKTRAKAKALEFLTPYQVSESLRGIYDDIRSPINVELLAARVNLSPSHFARAFKRSAGITPHRWILAERIASAQKLLSASTIDVEGIALLTGFAHRTPFSRAFSRMVGMSPGRWRRLNRAG